MGWVRIELSGADANQRYLAVQSAFSRLFSSYMSEAERDVAGLYRRGTRDHVIAYLTPVAADWMKSSGLIMEPSAPPVGDFHLTVGNGLLSDPTYAEKSPAERAAIRASLVLSDEDAEAEADEFELVMSGENPLSQPD